MPIASGATRHRPLPSRKSLRLQSQAEAQSPKTPTSSTPMSNAQVTEDPTPTPSFTHFPITVPLLADVPPRTDSGRRSGSPAPAVKRPAGWIRTLATLGTAGLMLTAALPGVTVLTDEAAPAAVGEQHLLLGALAEPNIDALGAVATEKIDAPASDGLLMNYAEAQVQYPVTSGVQLTDGFGYRTAPIAQFHNAQDFAAPEGTPVMAMANGTVTHVGYTNDGLGFNVEIEHEIKGQSVTSRYAHMQIDSAPVTVGATVAMGDRIGNVGNTGFSFGAHLHLVIEVDGEPVDPMVFIPQHNRATPLTEGS